MSETTAASRARPGRLIRVLGSLLLWASAAALVLLVAAQLVFFAIHAAHLLGYPYPLDYGEGPLLAQVDLLLAGTPIWHLYADPGLPPYAVVNYPPVYHLVAALAGWLLGGQGRAVLLAGRLVSLAAALGCVAALWVLTSSQQSAVSSQPPVAGARTFKPSFFILHPSSFVLRLLIVLAFLALPIVREWAVVMRVDMLGVCLGLWGLAVVRRNAGARAVLWAAPLLALSLLVKPSLIAAPSAVLLWLLFRDWRRALALGALLALIGGLVAGLLQLGSGGWFLLHVLAANANTWQRDLAYGFWHDQLAILWPLVAASVLSALARIAVACASLVRLRQSAPFRLWRFDFGRKAPKIETQKISGTLPTQAELAPAFQSPISALLLPLYYTLFGAIVAYGVGKVGAYANYFLEFYAGLIWLAALAFRPMTNGQRPTGSQTAVWPLVVGRWSLVAVLVTTLVAGALLRYYPTWSETYLKLAGIIEGRNPPRLIAGGYGVWRDLRRERDILDALAKINDSLDAEARAAGAPIFTDVPGVAAQAGYLSRVQAFEHRQLLDLGLWDQRPLLRDMANGRVPLVVLDYLGNWLTPEMIELIKHRYAQDGSRGTYDIYRPVDPGPPVAANLAFPGGLRLLAYHLAPPPGRPAYHAGETALLALDWQLAEGQAPPAADPLEVVVQLTDGQGNVFLETTRPLLYGALAPKDWGGQAIQHLQPIALPEELFPLNYHLAVTLRQNGRNLAPPRALAALPVEEQAGKTREGLLGSYYLPAPLQAAWERLGGAAGPGEPLTPAVPLNGYVLQCYARACLRLADGNVAQEPLGELVHLGDVGLRPLDAQAPANRVSDSFHAFWEAHGGAAALGEAITPELARGDAIVQYTRYARLERPAAGGEPRLGRLGEEYLRLPGGVPYRWP